MDCDYVHNFVNKLLYSCKELAICTVRSSQQHPNQPQVLHHQYSLPFHLVNRRKNHAGDDGTLTKYVIGGLAFGVNFNEQSNRTPRCSREVSAARFTLTLTLEFSVIRICLY